MGHPKYYFRQLRAQLGPQAWHNFRVDAFASLLFSLFNAVFNQFYIPMAIQQGANNMQVGLLAAAPAIGLLLSPLWASFIERSGPRRYMIYPNLIGRALIILPAFFGVPLVYVGVALLFQLLMGMQAPAYASMVTRIYPPQHRGRLMANVRVGMVILMIPLAYLVGYWTDAAGPSGPLAAAAVMGVVSILVFTRVKESEPQASAAATQKRGSFREQWSLVKQNRELGIFLAATTFTGFCNIMAGPLYQIIQVERLELTNVEIGYARMTYFACLLVAYFVVGWVIDRISAKSTIIYGLLAFAAVPTLYGLFGNYPSVLIGSGIQGIGDAIWDIGILAYVFRLAPGREAVVFGLHMLLFGIRGTIGPLLSTSLAGYGLSMSWLLLGAALFGWIGCALFIAMGRREKQAQAG
jgi:MFS transporter, DHA1 family, staphyloferrin B biosynthesis exporter